MRQKSIHLHSTIILPFKICIHPSLDTSSHERRTNDYSFQSYQNTTFNIFPVVHGRRVVLWREMCSAASFLSPQTELSDNWALYQMNQWYIALEDRIKVWNVKRRRFPCFCHGYHIVNHHTYPDIPTTKRVQCDHISDVSGNWASRVTTSNHNQTTDRAKLLLWSFVRREDHI